MCRRGIGKYHSPMNLHSAPFRCLAVLMAALMVVTPVSAQINLPDLGDPAQDALSPAQERKIGEEAYRQFRALDPNFLHDAEVEEYVNRVGKRLVAANGQTDQAYRFFVLNEKSINAFAMPGGYIGVHTGLITASESESELASVLAHEIGHVEQRHIARQLAGQGLATAAMLASLLVAVLASRSNSQISEAAIAGGTAYAMDRQLSYSRDFEREADRVGFQTLQSAGFDPQGMPHFFERLAQANRFNDFYAPAYLRTHPLTADRVSDIQGRAQHALPQRVPDSAEFQLVRAKLLAAQGTPTEATTKLATMEKAPASLKLYAQARIQLRENKPDAAQASLAQLRALGLRSSMLEHLAADIASARGQHDEAIRLCHDGQGLFPGVRALVLCEAEAALAAGKPQLTLQVVEPRLALDKQDAELFALQAKAYAAQGKTFQQQRAQAEVYYLNGSLGAAVEQLRLAQLSGGGDSFEQMAVDARLRELRRQLQEQMQERRQQGGGSR